MCGIAGIWRRRGGGAVETAQAMAARLAHRGPDDSGVWGDDVAGVAFGFRRLSIIDLSPAGHQPMSSASGRYTIVFNGEVYNFPALRRELDEAGAAPPWRGHSDTEVMLAAIEAWGLEAAVTRFVGMFAFALWDARARTLQLVRDRMGVKPLYYAPAASALLFASELKAMGAAEEFPRQVSREALALYLEHSYVPAPHTIYGGVFKVGAGTIVTIDERGARREREYWSLREVVARAAADPFRGSDAEALDEVERVASESVRLRMIADVPLGVFLSGGVDSSLVTALMQAQSSAPVKTFTIGFRESEYDEARYAAAVARHFGTEHEELYVTAAEAMDVIPSLPDIYDEPFADTSQIPTYLVSKLARRKVTVSLSGDGGDELFGGYHHYFLGQEFWRKVERVPRLVRPAAGRMMRAVPARMWDALLSPRRRLVPRALRRERAGDRIHKLGRAMSRPDAGGDPIERMMLRDQLSYLPDDILVKVDRASMAVSLEAREPLLDHRLIELAWRLPMAMKIREGEGKWVLRALLARYIPAALIERPKMGFGLPIDAWLRGPLRGWAESLLSERRLGEGGFFDVRAVREQWREHLAGRGQSQQFLWAVLMFQAWAGSEI